MEEVYGGIYSFLGCLIITIKEYGNGSPGFSTEGQANSVNSSAVGSGLFGLDSNRDL